MDSAATSLDDGAGVACGAVWDVVLATEANVLKSVFESQRVVIMRDRAAVGLEAAFKSTVGALCTGAFEPLREKIRKTGGASDKSDELERLALWHLTRVTLVQTKAVLELRFLAKAMEQRAMARKGEDVKDAHLDEMWAIESCVTMLQYTHTRIKEAMASDEWRANLEELCAYASEESSDRRTDHLLREFDAFSRGEVLTEPA